MNTQLSDTSKQILTIAIPAIVSNVTVPLLSLVDVAIVGHLGAASYIGAIAVGGMIFNVVYWIFGFLRMSTSGLTSQSLGARRLDEAVAHGVRSLVVALAIALLLILFQTPILHLALRVMSPSPQVAELASVYFRILIWGAPAMLSLFSFTGWFIGMQNSRLPMIIAITQNLVNIAASTFLVFCLGMKVEGVAIGTLVAQYSGVVMAVVAFRSEEGRVKSVEGRVKREEGRVKSEELSYFKFTQTVPPLQGEVGGGLKNGGFRLIVCDGQMLRFFRVSRDIFLRTVCLVAVMLFFTSAGAWQGDVVLAVNTLLMQCYMLFSYVMDGFAYSGEALCGKHYGAGNRPALRSTVGALFRWGWVMTALFTLAYFLGGDAFLSLLTDEPSVVSASADYWQWALLLPLCGVAAFVWDGVFIGCTLTRGMLLSMALAAATFFVVYLALRTHLANHGLWLAFLSYLAVRGVAQTVIWRKNVVNRGS